MVPVLYRSGVCLLLSAQLRASWSAFGDVCSKQSTWVLPCQIPLVTSGMCSAPEHGFCEWQHFQKSDWMTPEHTETSHELSPQAVGVCPVASRCSPPQKEL